MTRIDQETSRPVTAVMRLRAVLSPLTLTQPRPLSRLCNATAGADLTARSIAAKVAVHMTSTDVLLFLSSPDTIGSKQVRPGGVDAYHAPVGPFAAHCVPVASLAELARVLAQVPPNAFHVRGQTVGPATTQIPYRRIHARDGEAATLIAQTHRALVVDYEDRDQTAPPMADLRSAAAQARASLPPPLSAAECIAVATSSAGIKPGARLRLWFWADRPLGDRELKAWLGNTPGVDTSIYQPAQPIYCAPPQFLDGAVDPFPERLVTLPGNALILPEDLAPSVPPTHQPPLALQQALAGISGDVVQGDRNNALTSIAGSMRARGLDGTAILAALRQHNTTHVIPPLPDDELMRIAASVANYTPTAVPVTIPRTSKIADKVLTRQAKRVSEDPGLLASAAVALRPHLASGHLTETQVTSRLTAALKRADTLVAPTDVTALLRAVQEAPAPSDAALPLWQTELSISPEGTPRYGPENMCKVLRSHPDWGLWLDTRTGETQLQRAPADFRVPPQGRALVDADGPRLRCWYDRELGWPTLPCDPFDALRSVATDREWDPWTGALDALVWDGTARLVRAAETLLGCTTQREAITFAWWMVSAVARSYAPGCQVDYTIVLEGPQGAGKSSFLQELVVSSRYYSRISTQGDLRNPRVTGQLQGPVVIEIAELAALTNRDVAQTKEFLDCRDDKWQPLYGRTVITSPRRCVFAGTTDRDDYLHDSAGNRRYWPMAVAKIDLDALRAQRDQLWAEAVAAYKGGTRWYPTAAEAQRLGLAAAQEARREAGFAEDAFRELLKVRRVAGASLLGAPAAEAWMLDPEGRLCASTTSWIRGMLGIANREGGRALASMLTSVGWRQHRTADSRIWYDPKRYTP
jgi:hypothetical protein